MLNDALIAFGAKFELDGDLLRCRSCGRSIIISRYHESMNHGYGCRWDSVKHPWYILRDLLAKMSKPSYEGASDC